MKIIITDSVKSVNRIIRRENYAGKNTCGVEATTALNLAWQEVIREISQKGIADIQLVNNNTAAMIVLRIMQEEPSLLPFVPQESFCLATAAEVLTNMNLMRMNPYSKSADTKVNALEELIEKYEKTMRDKKLYDIPMVISDAINFVKKNGNEYAKDELETCWFSVPSCLEQEFLSMLANGKVPAEFTKPSGLPDVIYEFVKCYGIVNEADYIAKDIIEKKIPLGDVAVLCNIDTYAPYIEETFAKRGLKVTFTSGVSAASLDTVELLKDIISWYENGCKYQDLFNVAHNRLFVIKVGTGQEIAAREFIKGISYGIGYGSDRYKNPQRASYDVNHSGKETPVEENFRTVTLPEFGQLAEDIAATRDAAKILDLLTSFMKEHTWSRNKENRRITVPLLNLRKNIAATGLLFDTTKDALEYVRNRLEALTCPEPELPDAAAVVRLTSPECLERKHVYVLGMSDQEFRVSSAESPVLGDDLRKALFGTPPCGNVTLAADAVKRAEEVYRNTFSTAPAGSCITLTSSSADILSDGADVSASAFFEILASEKGIKPGEENRYYNITDYDVKVDRETAWPGFDVTYPATTDPIKLKFSKSRLDEFLKCPLKDHYQQDLRIDQEEYSEYDPGSWLKANEKGTFIHRILEKYANDALKENGSVSELFDENSPGFARAYQEALAETEKEVPAPNATIRDTEAEECRKIAAAYLSELHKDLHDTGWIVTACEENIDNNSWSDDFTVNGVDFQVTYTGTIDRIDRKEEDGKTVYRIADYKTGKYKKADKMNEETKQHLIYAEYLRKTYREVVGFEYLFISELQKKKKNWKVTFSGSELSSEILSDDNKTLLYDTFFRHDYLKKDYDEKNCVYCRYKDICLYKVK